MIRNGVLTVSGVRSILADGQAADLRFESRCGL